MHLVYLILCFLVLETYQEFPDVWFDDCEEIPDVTCFMDTEHELQVKYPRHVDVRFGNELTPLQRKDKPEVYYLANPNKYYTLFLIDPDVPYPLLPEFEHWLVVNIPGNKVKDGEVIADYIGPLPPYGSGLHRYVFLVYEQRRRLFVKQPRYTSTQTENRYGFSVNSFAEKFKLEGPIAGNFFQAQYDCYVDSANENLEEIQTLQNLYKLTTTQYPDFY